MKLFLLFLASHGLERFLFLLLSAEWLGFALLFLLPTQRLGGFFLFLTAERLGFLFLLSADGLEFFFPLLAPKGLGSFLLFLTAQGLGLFLFLPTNGLEFFFLFFHPRDGGLGAEPLRLQTVERWGGASGDAGQEAHISTLRPGRGARTPRSRRISEA
ncbi:MAG: hypothetical protein AAF415_02520 [Pseudomonadota bacterium]